MTLLIFDQWENGVDIYTDTIVTNADHQPLGTADKVWTFPRLRLAMALTGTSAIGEILAQHIANTPDLQDINDVNRNTPGALQDIHAHLTSERGDIGTATVYLFGFPSDSNKLTRIIYRSAFDYNSERSDASDDLGIKPQPQHEVTDPRNIEDIIALADRVRREQASGLSGERIPIGGSLIRTQLTEDAIHIGAVHQFPDDTNWAKT